MLVCQPRSVSQYYVPSETAADAAPDRNIPAMTSESTVYGVWLQVSGFLRSASQIG